LEASFRPEDILHKFLEGCGLGELEHTEPTLGLVGLMLGQKLVQVTVAEEIPRFVGEAVGGFFGCHRANCYGLKSGKDLLDLLAKVLGQIIPESMIRRTDRRLNRFFICLHGTELFGDEFPHLKLLTDCECVHSFKPQ